MRQQKARLHFVTRNQWYVKALISDRASSYDVQMYVRRRVSEPESREGGSQQLSGLLVILAISN